MLQKTKNLIVIEEIDERHYDPDTKDRSRDKSFKNISKKNLFFTSTQKLWEKSLKELKDYKEFRNYIKCFQRKERSCSNSKISRFYYNIISII